MTKKTTKKIKKPKVLFLLIIIIAIVAPTTWYFLENGSKPLDELLDGNDKVPEKKLQIVDTNSKSRPYAVMINNLNIAREVQSGLQDAYIVYEIVVEGGITRMMAIFKDVNSTRIGSTRSARHYYLDYALENDAIYVHWGESPQAASDIKTLSITDIDGMAYGNPYFYRDNSLKLSSEHTGYINLNEIKKLVSNKGYRTETNKDLLLNYSVDPINFNESQDALSANNVKIPYSASYITSYEYDSTTGLYKRITNGKAHVDYITKKQYTTKNIIVYQIENKDIVGGGKGRQEIGNIGSGEGYYITNGYAVPITWSKSNRTSQTVYKYKSTGKEIDVNDGNTFIQLQPKEQKLTIS